MCENEPKTTKKGQLIAESIRKTLLNVDLRIVDAESKHKLAYEDFKLLSKLGGSANIKKALRSKSESEVYRIYIENISKIKGELTYALDRVLSRYTPKYKRIWTMYFLEKASLQEIATETNYTRIAIDKIIYKLKCDLVDAFGVEGENYGN